MPDDLQDKWGAQALDVNKSWNRYQDVVKSGLSVSINTGTLGQSDTLSAASGDAVVAGTTHSFGSSTDVQIDTANSDNPRKDVVYVDSSGNVSVAKGTAESADPSGKTGRETYRPAPSDLSSTDAAVLAEVWVPAGASSVSGSDLTDRRLLADAVLNKLTVDNIPLTSWEKWASRRAGAEDNLVYETFFESIDAFQIGTNGSASVSLNQSQGCVQPDTGSTSDSDALLRRKINGNGSYTKWTWDKDRTLSAGYSILDSESDRVDYIQTGESNGVFEDRPGFGFKIVDVSGTVTVRGFSQASDGGSETTVDLTTSPGTNPLRLRAEFTAGTDIEFFVDGTSQGTINSGLPSGDTVAIAHEVFTAYLKNTSAVQRQSRLSHARVVQHE